MKRIVASLAFALALVAAAVLANPSAAHACGGYGGFDFERFNVEALVTQALDDDANARTAAVADLRRGGQRTLDLMLSIGAERHDSKRDAMRFDALVDRVAGQRDGHKSGLFWHTDLADAQREAGRRGLPVLSLRLNGSLSSWQVGPDARHFTANVYANPAVARDLKSRFVLHWQTLPGSHMMGGGGCSAPYLVTAGPAEHWVLDAQGRQIDALIGSHDMTAFVAWLQTAQGLARA